MFDQDRSIGTARLRHFRAMLALRGRSLSQTARACGVAPPHLRLVVLGERRASSKLVEGLRRELGDDALIFVDSAITRGDHEPNNHLRTDREAGRG